MFTIYTHDGVFHADETFACAICRLLNPSVKIIRTRDRHALNGRDLMHDILVDVGRLYDPQVGLYDHHQPDALKREDGHGYSSCGLIWLEYGRDVLEHLTDLGSFALLEETWLALDQGLILTIDLNDTGEAPYVPYGYGISQVISRFNPIGDTADRDAAFEKAVRVAEMILRNEIVQTAHRVQEKAYVRSVEPIMDRRLLILDRAAPWQEVVTTDPSMEGVLFVVFPHIDGKSWRLQTVPSSTDRFSKRKPLPEAWAGLEGDALVEVTGVVDGVFCHKARFIAGAKSYEGILALARLALDA